MNRHQALVSLFSCIFSWIFLTGDANAKIVPYYSIFGASYRSLEPVERHIKSLQEKGYEAVYERVEIPRQGYQYRIYIGRYDKMDVAQQTAENLKANKLITEFHIRKVMLPAAMAAIPDAKAVKNRWKFDDSAFPVIDPFAGKPARARSEKIVPQSDSQRGAAVRREGAGRGAPERQPGPPAVVPVAPVTVQKQTNPPVVRPEGGALLDGARSEFKAQRYDRALAMLQGVINQPALAEALREQALRLAADCYYSLGLKGNSQFLLTAAEQYKNILVRHPDPAAGNDLVYYHLAKSNEILSFFYEAAGAWDRLISTYPDSEFLPEAMFKLGSLLNQTGKYNRAAERLLAYLKKYPAGEGGYAKAANFMIADCYYQLHKEEFAGQWYDEGRKKWPDWHDIPVKTIINMGNYYFKAGKFSLSLQIFSFYQNLYPAGEFGKSSLHLMAASAEAMGATALALSLYRLFIDKYPQDEAADTCAMAMAALGVARPGVKYPYYVLPIDAYRSPLSAAETLLAKNTGGEKEAALLLLKGDALVQENRIKEGFASYLMLLNRFPRGKSSGEGRKKLKLLVRSLVNDSYEKGDYLAVADIYFQGSGTLVPGDDFTTAIRIGNSLFMTGLHDEASKIYEALQKIYPDRERENAIILALAKIDLAKNNNEVAEEKLLLLLNKGGGKDQVLRNEIKKTLADLYYKKGLWAKANQLYLDVLQTGGEGLGAVYINNGRALQAAKLSDKAIVNYLKALKDYERHPKSYRADILADIYGGLGDAYYDLKRYQDGIDAYRQALAQVGEGNNDVRKWLTYMIGKGSTLLKDFTGAEKSFAQVKANAAGEFWPKVTDYALDGSRRAGKFGY